MAENTEESETTTTEAPESEVDKMVQQLGNFEPESTEAPREETPQEETPDQTEESKSGEQREGEAVEANEEGEETPEEVQQLQEKIEELESKLEGGEEESSEEEESEESGEEKGEEASILDLSEEEFVEDPDVHAEIVSDPESFNEFLRSFGEKVSALTQEKVFEQLPQLVQKEAAKRVDQRMTVRSFWNDNPELEEHREVVAKKANQYNSENPDASLEEVFDNAAEMARRELDIEQQAQEADNEAQENPAFTPDQRGGNGSRPQPETEEEQDELDKMLSVMG